ncbi:MAG: hypothetical protein F4145_09220 [Boseongicola sp. SB0675_bin_26]|nr:hypothetical protein [Boseongicola sp. SB0675_bin_26]
MNCDIHLSEKLGVYADEVRRGLGIEIVPPCVNRSESGFAVSEGKLVYALGALKNVGLEATRLVTKARGDKPFVNVFDFARRVDLRQFGKRSLEMLVRSGALDELDRNRRRVLESLDALVAYSAAVFDQSNSDQRSLFGDAGEDLPEPRLASVDDWLPDERLEEEQAAIGFYLSGHPLDDYALALKLKGMLTLAELREKAERDDGAVGRVGVIVSGLQERKSGRGTRFFRMNISDPTGQATGIALFPENFDEVRRVLESTSQVIMSLEARPHEGQFDPVGRSAVPIDGVVAAGASAGIDVLIDAPEAVASIASVLTRFKDDSSVKGRGPVRITAFSVQLPDGATQDVPVDIGEGWPVSPQIKGALKSLPGVLAVEDLAM